MWHIQLDIWTMYAQSSVPSSITTLVLVPACALVLPEALVLQQRLIIQGTLHDRLFARHLLCGEFRNIFGDIISVSTHTYNSTMMHEQQNQTPK